MAVDPLLAAAFIDGRSDAPRRLLGVRVRRLCLWHRLLLNAVDSPLMRQGRVTFRDLRTAAGICRLRFGDSRIRRPWLVPACIYAGAMLRAIFETQQPDALNPLQRALTRQVDAFLEYAGDYLQTPAYAVVPAPMRPGCSAESRASAPDEIEHVSDLIRWSHWPESYIWELPIGRANWYRVLARRAAGVDVDFVTSDDKAFQDQLPAEFRHRPK